MGSKISAGELVSSTYNNLCQFSTNMLRTTAVSNSDPKSLLFDRKEFIDPCQKDINYILCHPEG
jgi:hypothetical protein